MVPPPLKAGKPGKGQAIPSGAAAIAACFKPLQGVAGIGKAYPRRCKPD
ncbi:MAG: hypothetical protein AAGF66_18560 [Cyanobacteria bacterium P01_H01_bin.119]